MDLNSTLVFVNVVKAGSFSKAAEALGIPVSTVSDRVSSLEKSLGVRLLNRTTRSLNLTDPGTDFFTKAEAALGSLLAATEEVSLSGGTPTGTLRITAPTDYAEDELAEAIGEYRKLYPKVKVELIFTNRYVDMVMEGFDIAIRGGELKDSSLIAKKIGTGQLIFAASPQYLKGKPAILHPRDMDQHEFLHFQRSEGKVADSSVRLKSKDGKTTVFRPDYKIAATGFRLLIEMAKNGDGILLAPEPLVYDEIHAKNLVRVLPDWSTGETPVHLVYQEQRFALPKVKAMIPILEAKMKDRVSRCTAVKKKREAAGE